MPEKCCVKRCNATRADGPINGKKIMFYSFPKDPERRARWLTIINNENHHSTRISKFTKLCSLHFVRNDMFNCRLKPSAVPTIFPGVTESESIIRHSMKRVKKIEEPSMIKDDVYECRFRLQRLVGPKMYPGVTKIESTRRFPPLNHDTNFEEPMIEDALYNCRLKPPAVATSVPGATDESVRIIEIRPLNQDIKTEEPIMIEETILGI